MFIFLCLICIGVYLIFSSFNKKGGENNGEISETDANSKYVKVLEDGTKVNTSPKLKENKKYKNLDITDLNLTQSDGMTNLKGYITNNTNETQEESTINILLMDDQGNEITRMGAHIKNLKAGETTLLNSSCTFDYSNTYDVIFQEQ